MYSKFVSVVQLISVFFVYTDAGGSGPTIKSLFGIGLGYQKVVSYRPVLMIHKPKKSLSSHIVYGPIGGGGHGGGGGSGGYKGGGGYKDSGKNIKLII